jgi:hypothetical protein
MVKLKLSERIDRKNVAYHIPDVAILSRLKFYLDVVSACE